MKLLIADDDPVYRRLLEKMLVRWGYEVVTARDGVEAWEALQGDEAPQLAIVDWMMPRIDGVEICRNVRRRQARLYTYLILLTSKGEKEEIVEGLEAGADDYLIKPFDAEELRVRLRAGRRILDLQRELITVQEALRYQADHDPLTGLWNHSAILAALQCQIERARREGIDLSVVMADLDCFKQINDTYGHVAGDTVLSMIAQRMRALIRHDDAVGRYGGEEFLLVLPRCDRTRAMEIADRIRRAIRGAPVRLGSETITVTLSLGVATIGPDSTVDPVTLVQAVDAALYQAKNRGRDRVEQTATDDSADPNLQAVLR